MTETMFTKTETRRRLRALKKAWMSVDYSVPRGPHRFELQTREVPAFGNTADEALAAYHANADVDDLYDFGDLNYLADEHRTHGALVHLVISRLDPWYGQELHDVQVAWMGTPDAEPVFLHRTRGGYTQVEVSA